MKRKLCILLMFWLSLPAFPQSETNIWYFGYNAGMEFNPDGSVTALTDGALFTSEGCSTFCNEAGAVLFYTNGIKVWNKNHQLMPNGTGLNGNTSTTQSAVIVPKPGSPNLYYIFTLDAYGLAKGFCYSIVDMNLNNGLGDVTAAKNIVVYTPSCEKLAVVQHANGEDFWVITHGVNNNIFYSHLLTADGLAATPVETAIGYMVPNTHQNTVIGQMKLSPDGTKLALAHYLYGAQLFRFNNVTGVISDAVTLDYSGTLGILHFYGIEFSPNSELVYVSCTVNLAPSQLKQYNTLAADIPGSGIVLQTNSANFEAMQLGINGRIYMAGIGGTALSVIQEPNIIGSGCAIQTDAFDLAGKTCGFGLPVIVSSFLNKPFDAENLCIGLVTQFYAETSQPFTSIHWDFGDGNTSSETNPQHQYALSGNYTVTRTVFMPNGTSVKNRQITISELPVIMSTAAVQQSCGANGEYHLEALDNVLLGGQPAAVFHVHYFITEQDALNGSNPIKVIGENMNHQMIYYSIAPRNSDDCKVTAGFQVDLFRMPAAAAMPVFQCDDPSNDGKAIFDLNELAAFTIGAQDPGLVNVTYHVSQQDADNDINALPVMYENISNPQQLYVRVENSTHAGCYVVLDFPIGARRLPLPIKPQDLFACDEDNDGHEHFLLTDQDAAILGTQPEDTFTITYHTSQENADRGLNPLPGDYENTANPQTVFVRMANKLPYPTCYDTTSFVLNVRNKPVIDMQDTYPICSGVPITITAPFGFSSYLWSDGAVTQSVRITTPGSYNVTVTKNYNDIICETTKEITVLGSGIPVITDIRTSDWTDNQNMISIFATGDGDYEYSLDGISYQDSPDFYSVDNGQYQVFVRDKRGCGTDKQEVLLLMYPHYFTPNGDGYNDHWKITFSAIEPQMHVQVYDRYGKLIAGYTGNDAGWDGTLNGHPLPATDYWFVVKRQNGKEYRGHFTLKR